MLAQDALWAAIPPTLISSTCTAATLVAGGTAATRLISIQAAGLTEGMVKTMMMTKVKMILSLAVAVAILAAGVGLWTAHHIQAGERSTLQAKAKGDKPKPKAAGKGDAANLVKRGEYLVNQVARCGDCHTPRNAKGSLDMARHLQGAPMWFTPKVKRGEFEGRAPDITTTGKAGKWNENKMIQFFFKGEKSDPPMPVYKLTMEDARAVTAYLRSVPGKKDGKKKGKGRKKKEDDDDDDDDD
jgi:mono/diheme cytochrome c family protein